MKEFGPKRTAGQAALQSWSLGLGPEEEGREGLVRPRPSLPAPPINDGYGDAGLGWAGDGE